MFYCFPPVTQHLLFSLVPLDHSHRHQPSCHSRDESLQTSSREKNESIPTSQLYKNNFISRKKTETPYLLIVLQTVFIWKKIIAITTKLLNKMIVSHLFEENTCSSRGRREREKMEGKEIAIKYRSKWMLYRCTCIALYPEYPRGTANQKDNSSDISLV